jgi:hypothetical protein
VRCCRASSPRSSRRRSSSSVLRVGISLDDAEPERLIEAGTVGGAGHLELQYFVLDDFAYTDLDQ